ncbi:hypothetical protein C0993_011996 [Termitomyces sp. T159_Od127]|nr:hypothetical protein C0993_011996 [Termitomyces sp. T159_Od127]
MQFFSLTLTALISLLISSSRGVILSHDKAYDAASASLDTVACSDGTNGLETRGYKTFGSIPNFPNIGGASTISGWNSPKCGACYNLTFVGANKQNRSVAITAVDRTGLGFNIAQSAFEKLVGSADVGKAEVDVQEVDRSFCGFK